MKPQIVAYRTNGHWNVMVHLANNTVKLFADLIADMALAVVALFQRRGASVAEMASTRFLDLLLAAAV
jgi:hypothetical protein